MFRLSAYKTFYRPAEQEDDFVSSLIFRLNRAVAKRKAISTNNIDTEVPQLLLIVSILTHVIVKKSTHEQNIKK